MKSNKKKRVLAAVLCMVMVLSSNISALAGEEIFVDAPADAVELSSEPAEVFEAEPEVIVDDVTGGEPAPSQTEPTEPAPTETEVTESPAADQTQSAPAETTEDPAAADVFFSDGSEPTPVSETEPQSNPAAPETTTDAASAPETTTDAAPAPETTPATGETPEQTGDFTADGESVPDLGDGAGMNEKLSAATELKQEFVDGEGNVVQRVTANLPVGAFAAETSDITMEVNYLDADSENRIKAMMNEQLPEGMQLGTYVFFDIQFKVKGEKAEALQPITITIEGSNLKITDTKRANVFYFDRAEAEGEQDKLQEIAQRSEVLESLQAAGQSTENIEDYDLSEITFREDGSTDKIIFEGRKSTIYGCYVEEEKPAEEIETPEVPETPETPETEEPETNGEASGETEATEIEILLEEVNLRTEPNAEADNVAALAYAGDRFPLIETVTVGEEIWYKIQYVNPETGEASELYVRNDCAQIVEENIEVTDDETVELTEESGTTTELTYEDDKISVIVSAAEEGIIPEGAALQVVPITVENEAYEGVAAQIEEKVAEEEKEVAGFLAYDISFVDAEGNELEPNGEVKVSLNYKEAAIPETVTEEKAETTEVAVYHLEEDAEGQVQNVVDMTAAENAQTAIETTETAEIQSAEFLTTGFSVYTVVWVDQGDRWNRPTATLHFVDERGRDISSKLDVGHRDKEIEISGTGNLGGDSAAHKDLNAIGEQYSEKNGYYYEAAHLDAYNDEKIADDISYNPNDKNGYDWHYLFAGSWHGWKMDDRYGNNREVDVYLVYTDKKPESLSYVPTVDSTSKGVTMKMIDLGGGETNLTNSGTTVNFGSTSGYGDGSIKSGLLNSRITNRDGFPTVKNDRESLGRLFDGAKEVNYLFRQDIFDESGYFEYSSFENYAYLGRSDSFTVYNQIGTPSDGNNYFYQRGNFMPYNEIKDGKFSHNRNLYDENGNKLERGDHRYNERLYKTQGNNNFQFGMMLEAEFTQQRDGMATHNGTTSPMVYEFNGDDDLWVFIDDVLVLDIGGVHDAHSGSIDFSTGDVVWYDCTTGATPRRKETTLKTIFQNAGVLPSGNRWTDAGARKEFRDDTFADYTTDHSFKMYYFERGAGASNLHVKFNLPTVPKDSVNIQKVVQNEHGQDANYADDIDFLFEIEVEGRKYANEPYEILNLGHQVIGNGTTDKNAQFTLKHNQIARFSGIEEDKSYRVKELGAYLDGYEVEIGGTVTWTPDDNKRKPYPDSGELNVGQNSTAVFINKMLRSATLNITKELADPTKPTDKEFQIELKLGDDLYKGTYTIGRDTFKAENGIIKLKAGQTATITGLPYGVKFEARELMDGSYLPTYGITGKDVANIQLPEIKEDGTSNGISSASAQINGDTCTLTVTNKEILVGAGQTSVSVKKNWDEETMAGVPIPEYVDVYLYKDVNQNGEYDEGTDTEMARESIRLNNDNGWSGSWDGLPGDTDYVVKEVYPPGYEQINTESDNSFDDINQVGERNTPNNNTVFNLGVNNLLLVKVTGNHYFLWSPIDLNLDQNDISYIVGEIKKLELEGTGNLDLTNLSYRHGVGDFQNISLERLDNGWKLSFNGKSAWAMFWTFQYHRTQSITLTNSLDREAFTSVKVEKKWTGDNRLNRPQNVTVQLYQKDEPMGKSVVLDSSNRWKHTFENLPIYTVNGGTVTKNVYTVKEIMIGDDHVDLNGNALGYHSSVEKIVDEDGITKFVITNAKDWQIVKVSESNNNLKLDGAVFELTKDDKVIAYGKSGNGGVVSWYTNEECNIPFEGTFENGIYTLKEIKAPSGYAISEETWTIRINNGSAEITSSDGTEIEALKSGGKDTFYFKNAPIYDLPSTGGNGIFGYMIGGVAMMMAAMFILYKMRRKGVLRS